MGVGVGVAANAYGSWLIAVAVVVVALFVRLRWSAWRQAIAYMVAAVIPTLVWVVVCKIYAGSYYNHEAAVYRQFVWVLDAAQEGPAELWHRVSSYFLLSVRAALGVAELWLAAGLIAVGVIIAAIRRISLRPTNDDDRATLTAIALTEVVSFFFLYGIGYYTPRLSILLFPPMLMLIGWIAARLLANASAVTRKYVVPTVAVLAASAWFAAMLT